VILRQLKSIVVNIALSDARAPFTHPAIASPGHPLSGKPERGLDFS
jgi:hypothetical protein